MKGAGKKNRFLSWQRNVSLKSGTGAKLAPSWVEQGRFWGSVVSTSGAESRAGNAVRSPHDFEVYIYFGPLVAAFDRLVDTDSGAIYDVQALADPTGRNAELKLMCKTGANVHV